MTHATGTSPRRAFAVVPAAGRSVRMGEPKLLLPWDAAGRTLIEHVLAAWRSGGATHTVVTVHPEDHRLAEVCRGAGAEVVVPPVPPSDMKASVSISLENLAARHAPTDDDVWLVAPADLPGLSPEVISQLLKTWDRRRPAILRPMHDGRAGHPLLLPWSAAAEVARIPAGRGLDELLERLRVVDVAAGPECLASDVDTPDDYRRLCDRS